MKTDDARNDAPFFLLLSIMLPLWGILIGSIARYFLGIDLIAAIYCFFSLGVLSSILLLRTKSRKIRENLTNLVFFVSYTLLLSTIGFYFAYSHLYLFAFEGMPQVGGGDAGSHLYQARMFLLRDPHQYEGMTSPYAVWFFLSKTFGISLLKSISISLYFFWVQFFAFIASIFWKIAEVVEEGKKKALLLTVLTILLGAGCVRVLPLIAFPVFHYFQADGFYPQIIIVTLFINLLTLLIFSPNNSITIFLTSLYVVFARFTYALNFGDILISFAIILPFLKIQNRNHKLIVASKSLYTIALICAGLIVQYKLVEKQVANGRTAPYDHLLVDLCNAKILAVLGLLLVNFITHPGFLKRNRNIVFIMTFLIVFCGIGLTDRLLWRHFDLPLRYYYLKHSMMPTLMLQLGCLTFIIGSFGHTIVSFFDERKHLKYYMKSALIIFSATFVFLGIAPTLRNALFNYYKSYLERSPNNRKTFNEISFLVDRGVEKKIREVLSEKNIYFGGYWTYDWPVYSFMNEAIILEEVLFTNNSTTKKGLPVAYSDTMETHARFYFGTTILENGRCFFFNREILYNEQNELKSEVNGNAVGLLDLQKRNPQQCEVIPEGKGASAPRNLCWICS